MQPGGYRGRNDYTMELKSEQIMGTWTQKGVLVKTERKKEEKAQESTHSPFSWKYSQTALTVAKVHCAP